jgi:Collagen triple helix repeat (20 copies)
MKRLRHPIRAIREPFGTAGLIVAMIALVAALGGTALAAAKLNSTQKKEVEKIAKKYAGKSGATGPAGAAGATGPAGKEGAEGLAGKNGKDGSEGKEGKEGSPWTAGGTLPAGAAETGTWGYGPLVAEVTALKLRVPISFTIPLAAPLDEQHVQFIGPEETGTGGCEGGTFEEPKAKSGFLCVYRNSSDTAPATSYRALNPEVEFAFGVGRSGTVLTTLGSPEGSIATGVWMVRG